MKLTVLIETLCRAVVAFVALPSVLFWLLVGITNATGRTRRQ